MVLPDGEKSFSAENRPKVAGYVLFTSSNSGLPWMLLRETSNPTPGVEKTTPRGELTLKKSGGRRLGEDMAAGTPSQLISRRPPSAEPATFGFKGPSALRNESTVA